MALRFHIKGINNIVANAISQLDFTPPVKQSEQQNRMTLTKHWCNIRQDVVHNYSNMQNIESMNYVFANCSDDNEIYPLTIKEISQEQRKGKDICALKKKEQCKVQLVENTEVLCKDGKLVIPKSLQHRTVSWYHITSLDTHI